uniref:Uncharacterized protein n=1 Tax=Podoviridae sp. ctZkC8 TaxID=2825259 RepID=A0A8S5UC58_9CAUD|nr:MAG TPA: hypothetical protein [Podoviridae sp. ctZkC8]
MKSLSVVSFTYKVTAWIFTSILINYILYHLLLPIWTKRINRVSKY